MEKSFTKLELKSGEGTKLYMLEKEDGTIVVESRIKSSHKHDILRMPKVQTREKTPRFIIPGASYSHGSIDENNLVCVDSRGSEFTYVPADDHCDAFWVSTYQISRNEITGEIKSVRGKYPYTKVGLIEARNIARTYGGALLSTKQYNRILRYMVETHAISQKEAYHDSTLLGNFWNNPEKAQRILVTGCNPNWCFNGIFDFFGNSRCITTDEKSPTGFAVRGGDFINYGDATPASYYDNCDCEWTPNIHTGFRIVFAREHCA